MAAQWVGGHQSSGEESRREDNRRQPSKWMTTNGNEPQPQVWLGRKA